MNNLLSPLSSACRDKNGFVVVSQAAGEMIQKMLPRFHQGNQVKGVANDARIVPCHPEAPESIKCPMCGSGDGYRVRHHVNGRYGHFVWACRNEKCITINGTLPSYRNVKVTNQSDIMRIMGVPAILDEASFKDWTHGEGNRKLLIDWVRKPTTFCVLSGKRGTGKSYIAACMGSLYMFEKGKRAVFVDILTLKKKWLNEVRENKPMNYTTSLCECEFLVLDDLGQVNPSDSFYEVLFDIINQRYANRMPTVITTNLTEEEIQKQLGDPISSRIHSKGNLYLEMAGKDLR